ncbi:MAG: glycosyltransferase [Solirubrobacteraceae bacterium]
MVLDAARPFGLVIYDRTLGVNSDEYGFPDRFAPHIKGRLPYDQVIAVYKRHRVFLNVNSVVDSPTMFSRRVFELLACGTAVLSTESVGISAMFGDLVPIVESPEQAKTELKRLLHDDTYHAELTGRARRLVLSEHTYRQRLAGIAKTAGFELSSTAGEEIGALALIDEPSGLRSIAAALLAQSRAPEEILVGLGMQSDIGGGVDRLVERFGAERVRTVVQEESTDRHERWRELAALTTASWVAPLTPGAPYGEHHLRDLSGCTTFASADVIGVAPAEAQAHRYVKSAPPAAALSTRALIAQHGWMEDVSQQRRWFEDGVRFYAGEPESTLGPSSPAATRAGPSAVGGPARGSAEVGGAPGVGPAETGNTPRFSRRTRRR